MHKRECALTLGNILTPLKTQGVSQLGMVVYTPRMPQFCQQAGYLSYLEVVELILHSSDSMIISEVN